MMATGKTVRFEQSWLELSSTLRKRTAQRRLAITESERSDSEWVYASSSSASAQPAKSSCYAEPRNGAPPVDNLPDKEEAVLLPTVKRIFAPPKAAVPVEIRRQRRLLVSPPTAPPPPPPPPPPPAPFREYQSLPIQQPKRSHGVKQEDCGLFRQIFSDDEAAMIVYNFPGIHRKPEELVYAEPSMECSSTDPMFSSSSSSDYADPFEHRKRSGSLPDHHYVELDDVMDRHLSLGHRRAVFLCDTPTRFDSVSDDMYLEGPTAPIPVGLTRTRTVHFESMTQEPNNNMLMQAVGPQLALYSLTSLPPAHLMDDEKESCCQSSMMSADNDEFFMEFSIQRIPVPSEEEEVAVTSSSSSSVSQSSLSISSTESSSSSSIQSVVEMPKKPRKVSFLEPAETVKLDRTSSRKRKMNKHEERRAGKLDFIRLLRHTLSAIGRCGLSSAQSVLSSHLSSSEDVDSLFSSDDLLSQSDLDMFCKESKDHCTEDSGTDEMATSPEPQKSSSVYGGTLTDIENTLNILENKARRSMTDSSTSSSEEEGRSSSGSSGCSCESSSCSYWSEDDWIFDDDEEGPVSPHDTSLDLGSSDTSRMEDPGSPTQPNDGKHSLLQFALYHFRQSPENKFEMLRSEDGPNSLSPSTNGKSDKKSKSKSKKSGAKDQSRSSDGVTAGSDWTWKEQVDLVKFTKSPIQASLLQLDSNDLNKLALECFLSIMRYMGDYPMAKGQSEVDNVYTILMNCHKHESLRDETYCQIMKQTTNNKSSRPDSCQRGWRLFSITAAYFSCSEVLKPYLFKYLETAAYDKRRAYHGTAMVCLQNLRKTLRYGGRKNVPSIEEITAITAGRNSKRQMYRLPGGTERVINTKSTSVVQDIIEEICSVINVRSEQEMEEYSLYCIVEGDTFTMPLAREEYILDVTTELQKNQQVYYLIFCRSVWHYPMRLDNSLYIEIVFNQIAPDYLEGLLLVMPGEQISQDCVYDIAKVAALLHRAADLDHMPTMKETKYLLPKPALSVRDIKPPQWVNLVQSSWREVEHLKPSQAKAQVLEILEKWPLFGSSFFAVRRDSDPAERSEHILALNRNGVHFLDVITHETLMHHPYSEVISTRKVKSDDGILFLDMKCGNLMQQRVTRIQTDQAHEISRLIRQYITIQQRVQQKDAESNLASR